MATSVTSYVDVTDERNAPSPKYFTAPNTWLALREKMIKTNYPIVTFNSDYNSSNGGYISNPFDSPISVFNEPVKMSDNETTARSMFGGGGDVTVDLGIPMKNKPETNQCVYYHSGGVAVTFNSEVIISKNVTDCTSMFWGCYSYNQRVVIPNKVVNCQNMFYDCRSYNVPTVITNGVKNCFRMFTNCYSLNQPIVIPDSVLCCAEMFRNCNSMNANVVLGNNVTDCQNMFRGYKGYGPWICPVMNIDNFYIPGSVQTCANMFCDSGTPKNIFINNGGYNMYLYGLLQNKFSSHRVNVYCSNIAKINGSQNNANCIVGVYEISWTSMMNGYYNSQYNIYLYQNYSG